MLIKNNDSGDEIEKDKMVGASGTAFLGKRRNTYRDLVRIFEGKRPPGRPRLKWKDNIKRDLKEIGRESVDLFNFAQDREKWWAS